MCGKVVVLSLYPCSDDYYNTTVTTVGGVCKILVETATVLGHIIENDERHSYQITITALDVDERFASVQLNSRRWCKRTLRGTQENVSGEGIIGQYPHFQQGRSYV
jgi:uncharacterized protein affecting Mg2+/Co2+ transport